MIENLMIIHTYCWAPTMIGSVLCPKHDCVCKDLRYVTPMLMQWSFEINYWFKNGCMVDNEKYIIYYEHNAYHDNIC